MQSLHIFDTVILVRLGRFAIIHLPYGLVTFLLQIGPACQISDDPSERVPEVHASGDWILMLASEKTAARVELTAGVRSQENLFLFQEALTKNIAQD